MEVADPPGPRVNVLGLREVRGTSGDEEAVRMMLPEKAPRLDTVIELVPEAPWARLRELGFADTAKSTTCTVIVTECDSELLVPVTVTV